MSQTTHQDPEGGNNPDGHHDQPQSTPKHPSQGESTFGDSSGPLFSMYSKAAEEEDNDMVERWQKDADGILIFTGLFSASVAAFLAVTVQDLRPNSQDTSAFYLGNIYGVLADPNATRTSIPSPVVPPPFSAPRYAVWVNSLWFLSLVMSLSCALWATSLHQWARRYIRLTQPARCSPEKRARMRAFFAEGVDKMHIPWAVEGLPTLLHLSLFLFFSGLVIYLFNVDHDVFLCVIWWIGLFSTVYVLITLLPLIQHNSPYNSPLSLPAWFLYSNVKYVTVTVVSFIASWYGSQQTWLHHECLRFRYRGWMYGGVEKAAEEDASKRSSEIDVGILGWTTRALGDDGSLEKFFEAIPGFFNSKQVKDLEKYLPLTQLETFWRVLDSFMGRTLSSNSIMESVKSCRINICGDIVSMIPRPRHVSFALHSDFDQAPVSIERLQAMARWFTHLSPFVSDAARISVAVNLTRTQERDTRWVVLANDAYGLAASVLLRNVRLGGDNVLLAILNHVSRQGIWEIVKELTHFDIRHTLPGLQHDFCTMWNEVVQKARDEERNIPDHSRSVDILQQLHRHYITLHQGTDAAPTAFVNDFYIPMVPSSYPLCDIASHRPDLITDIPQCAHSLNASPHHSTSGGSVSRQVKQASIIGGSPPSSEWTKSSEIGDNSQGPAATSPALPVHTVTSPCPTDASPLGAVAAALQNIPLAATDNSEILSHASTLAPTPKLAPVPATDTAILRKSFTSRDAGIADSFLPASSVVTGSSSIPVSPPPSRVHPSPKTPSNLTGNATLPHLRARVLVNSGNMSFANGVLHLLVHSPPFWNLFVELGDLKGKSGAGSLETGCAIPLVDATVRFFEEFISKEEEQPTTQQPLQLAARGKQREEEKKERKVVDSFDPTYLYDVMKEKSQLKNLLDGKHEDAEEFLGLYLDALENELDELHTYIGAQKPTSALSVEELEKEAQSVEDQTEAGKRDHAAGSVESPISRIFGGRSRLSLRAPSKPDTITTKVWRSLKLYIQPDSVHTVQDALAHLSQPQPVQVGQSSPGEVSQQVLLEVLPPVLVLHLERFLCDAATDGVNKISKHIQFTPELEILSEIMAPIAGKSAEAVHYKLSGVLHSNGETASSGHYTVDVLHPNGDCGSGEVWLNIDDEAVRAVRHEDVFVGRDNGQVDDRCACMLFYCRTPTQT